MATIIFSNAGDTDTAVLKFIWRGLPNVKLVEVNKQTVNAKEIVERAIEAEHDTLICCGHGSPMGLYNPAGSGYSFLINRQNYKKIKVNRFIGVWCHASEFGEAVHLKGFYSSMFISNKNEAEMNHCYQASAKCITEQEILFALRLNELIGKYVPMKKWVGLLNEAADKTIDVVKFNYDGLKYLTKFEGEVPEYTEYGYRSYIYSGSAGGGFYGSTYGGSASSSKYRTRPGRHRHGQDRLASRYVDLRGRLRHRSGTVLHHDQKDRNREDGFRDADVALEPVRRILP